MQFSLRQTLLHESFSTITLQLDPHWSFPRNLDTDAEEIFEITQIKCEEFFGNIVEYLTLHFG